MTKKANIFFKTATGQILSKFKAKKGHGVNFLTPLLQKLKQKLYKIREPKFYLKPLIILTTFLAFLAIPLFAEAAFSPSSSCAGGLATSFSNSYDCPQGQLTIDPSTVKIGDKVTATWNITDSNAVAQYQGQPRTVQLFVCPDASGDCPTSTGSNFQMFSNDITSGSVPISAQVGIGNPITKAGTYRIKGNLQYVDKSKAPGITYVNFIGYFSLTVQEADKTGQASLSLSLVQSSTPDKSTVTKKFSVIYSDGGTGKKISKITYLCGLDGESAQNPFSDNTFVCTYTSSPKDYTVTVTATLDDGTKITQTQKVTITGTEFSSGSQAGVVKGTGILALINEIIGFILGLIQEFVFLVFYWLIAPLIQAMLSIHVYTDTFAAVIYPGWEVIRNVCNIFFIVALIIIAMATLFRVESYQFRHLLVQLILAALLINFSLVIGQAVLGVADTVQSQFLPNNVDVIRSLARDLMVPYRSIVYNTNFLSNDNFSGTVQPLFLLALSLGSFFVFCAIAVFLVIRIVALWVLLMISPVAYAVGVLPSTEQYRKKWWDLFLKYAFFTPIMAFFLNLTAVISNTYKNNSVFKTISGDPNALGGSDVAKFVFTVSSNILLLVFLIAALKVAEEAGIMGASTITGIAQKGTLAPFKIAGGAAFGYAGRKWNEFTANKIRGDKDKVSGIRAVSYALLNPIAFGKGWVKERDKKIHSAQEKAELAGQEVVQQRFASPKAFFKGGYKILPLVQQHEKVEADATVKELQSMSREKVAAAAHRIFKMADDEDGRRTRRGIYSLAMSKGYIDDIIQLAHTNEEGQEMIKKMVDEGWITAADFNEFRQATDEETAAGNADAEGNYLDGNGNKVKDGKSLTYNNNTRRALQKAMFGWDGKHLKDHAAMRMITEEGETEGKNTGHLEYMTDWKYDAETGEYEEYKLDPATGRSAGEVEMAGREIAKLDSRKQAGVAWHSLMSDDGKYFSSGIFKRIAKAVKENPTWMQERTANKLVTGKVDGARVDRIAKKYKDKRILEMDEKSATRLKQMIKDDSGAAASVIQRFINEGDPRKAEELVKHGQITLEVNGATQVISLEGDHQGEVITDPTKIKADRHGLPPPPPP